MLFAKKARALVKTYMDKGTNYQRDWAFDKIEYYSRGGKTLLMLDDPHIRMFEEDYVFFEKLGYTVQRPYRGPADEKGMAMHYFGRISWK